MAQMTRINQQNNQLIADFLQFLKATQENNGEPLQNSTLARFGDSMTDGQRWGRELPHDSGRARGRSKAGKQIKFCHTPTYDPSQKSWPLANIPSANLYLSILQAADVPVKQFANATGLLPDLSA